MWSKNTVCLFSRAMGIVPDWVRWKKHMTAGGFLFEMLLMLPQHSRWYTAFSVPKPSSYPDALDILVRLCADIVRGGPFHFGRYVLDSFTLLQYLIDEIMVWARSLVFPLPWICRSTAPRFSLSPFVFFCACGFTEAYQKKMTRLDKCFRICLRFRVRFKQLFILP